MFPRRTLPVIVAALVVAVVAFTGVAAQADPAPPPGTPTAATAVPVATVGPLFAHGLGANHSCTASVVASPSRDLIITAAHCLSGTGRGVLFAPGYDSGRTPYGVWTVTQTFVDPRWRIERNTQYDYAILRVAPQNVDGRIRRVQDVVGANVLSTAPPSGRRIVDVAYNSGIDDRPIQCSTTVYRTDGYPAFNCRGYVGGSSGSPWLTRLPGGIDVVQGVIGGLHQGGCYDFTSYSSRFGVSVYDLLWRATARISPDTLPPAGSDGC